MSQNMELPQAREVCPTTTRRLVGEGALLVDVRERSEIDALAFDVPELVVMPLSEFEQRYSELPRDRELVIVCRSGNRSLKATYFLMYQGYSRVSNMSGGMVKWLSKGFPVVGQRFEAPAASASCCAGSGCAPSTADNGACCGASADQAQAETASSCCSTTAAKTSCC
ncbi:rhodanese-like domain-containing protein [Malikia granosa]|uniref:Hydrolase n=1 Tax=Malikia granosa TaxID=263067 RepID=A0A2S9K3A7_9BURK|nr:rhodanese-like domain-containing protein [Malikia granosa]PRD64874.1 hydrolase [Malikia granosa]